MLPENKNAIIYGAGGAIGGAVAHAFCPRGGEGLSYGSHFHRGRRLGAAYAAVEALSRGIVAELGPQGIRVVCLRSNAISLLRRKIEHPRPQSPG